MNYIQLWKRNIVRYKRLLLALALLGVCYHLFGIKQIPSILQSTQQFNSTIPCNNEQLIKYNLTELKELSRKISDRIGTIELQLNAGVYKPEFHKPEPHKPQPHKPDENSNPILEPPEEPIDSNRKDELPHRPPLNIVKPIHNPMLDHFHHGSTPVQVRFPLNATEMHVYYRTEPFAEGRRDLIRKYFKMWMDTPGKSQIKADYMFVTLEMPETILENSLHNDMVLTLQEKLNPILEKGKFDDAMFYEAVKYSAYSGLQNPDHVNLYAASTDVVNFDTIRNTISQMASRHQKESNVVCFGPINRNKLYPVPGCGNKVLIRSDHTLKIWNEMIKIQSSKSYNSTLMKGGYLTGLARSNAGIRGVTQNKQLEAIVTLPYEIAEYSKFSKEFSRWGMDLYPTSLMRYELPPLYTQDAVKDWNVDLEVSPECLTDHPYLSLVKTARNNSDNRNLIRIHYSLDLRRIKTVPLPAVRFLIGRGGPTEDKSISEKIEKEIKEHNDIIVGGFEDTYDNLPLKTLTGYTYIKTHCGPLNSNPKWVMFHDDDALIYSEKAINFFQGSKAASMNCFGFLGEHSRPHRWGKYNVTFDQWETGHWFPKFCSGPCNGMSKQAALNIFHTATKTDAKGLRLEDVLFTGIIRTKANMSVPHYEKVCTHCLPVQLPSFNEMFKR